MTATYTTAAQIDVGDIIRDDDGIPRRVDRRTGAAPLVGLHLDSGELLVLDMLAPVAHMTVTT